MNYQLANLAVHLAAILIGLYLTSPTKPPKRYTLGHLVAIKLNGGHRVYWVPADDA